MDTTGANELEALPWRDTDWSGRSGGAGTDAGTDVDVEATLRSLDGVTAESDPLRLEPSFRTAWRDRIVAIRDRSGQLEALAARLAVDPGRLALAVTADGFEATCDRTRIGIWPSNAAFLADLAATAVLDDRSVGWGDLEAGEQRAALTALRLFLDRCPNCDGAVVGTATAAETSAAAGRRVACDRCGVVLVRETPYDDSSLVSTVR